MDKMHIKIIFLWIILLFSSELLMAQENAPDPKENPYSLSMLMDNDSLANLPFRTAKKEFSNGSISIIDPEKLMLFDNIQDVSSALYGRISGMRGLRIHEFDDALVIVDGVPRPLSSINLQEIDQITVLKDANASVLYGVQALNGVILIKTRRGKIADPKVSFWAEYGLSRPISYPKYLNSADYMELYNEARINDGLTERYSTDEIAATRNKVDLLRYPDVDYYNSTFLKNFLPEARVVADFDGGNENARYYINADYLHSGSLLKLGEGENEQRNKFNLRSNINFKINDYMKSYLDILAIYDTEKNVNGDFWNDAATLRPNLYPLLIDSSRINYPGATLINGKYLLGGTSQYTHNVYGDLYFGGYSNTMNTTAQFTTGVDFDLGSILKGLTFKAQGSFDFYKRFTESLNNQYAVFELSSWDNGIPKIVKIGSDRFSGNQGIGNSNIRRVYSFSGLLNYLHNFNKKSTLSISLIPFLNRMKETNLNVIIDDRYTHIGANINYVYNQKYIFDFSSASTYSVKLPEGNRNAFSPTASVGWIISKEDFLSSSKVVNFLKVKASAGILNSDINISDYYLYKDFFAQSGSFSWNDGLRKNSRTIFQSVANSNLFYEKIKDLNLGVEAAFFNRSFWVDVNVFRKRYSDQVLQQKANFLDYLGGFVPYTNFGEDQYSGIDLGVLWTKSYHDLNIDIGMNLSYLKTEVLKASEIWEYDYQYQKGKPVNAIFGLESMGLFRDADDINSHATQMFGPVAPGDIKYVDQNDDGVIDDNDRIMIGSSTPDFYGGLNIKLRYKNFTLFGIVTAMQGAKRIYNNSYYWVYGDRKYSEHVLNRWTENTASTATYPRLSTLDNSNNFRNSTYWLYDNSRLDVDRIQFSYNLKKSINSLKIDKLSFYIRGSHLATISKNRERMNLNIGSEPQYRFYSIGVKALFF
jgi:TonB-linked SusC/RagA family outer membrane protein